jgi:putative MATE family efflux protein
MKRHPYLKEFARYSLLSVLGMIGLSCYILADTFFISQGLGANGLAALNLAIPVYSIISGCGMMLGMGGATKYAVCRGQHAKTQINRIFTNTVFIAVVVAVLFCLTGLFLSNEITSLLGADAEIFVMTNIYLKVILLFSPAFILNDILICFVRNNGNPRLSMIAMLCGSFSNIILDYIFIFPLHMGMFGAVFATGLAPIISMLILSRHWIARKNDFHLEKSRPNLGMSRSIFSIGFPSFITELSSGIVIIAFNGIILGLAGNVGVAAYGVIANISLVMVAIYTGIAQGMQPLVSKAYGRGDTIKMKQVLHYAVTTVLVLSGIIYIAIFLLADPIAGIFNSEHNVQLQNFATFGLRIYFTGVAFVGFNIILSMYFAAMDKAFPAQVISLLRGLILILPMAFLLSAVGGITGVWLAVPVTEGLVAGIVIFLYDTVIKKAGGNPWER